MQVPKVKIDHPTFELEVKLNELYIDLLLYDYLKSCFYSQRLTQSSLPAPANSLFTSVEDLFSYFMYLSQQPIQLCDLIVFKKENLVLNTTICQGEKHLKVVFNLKEADMVDNLNLLKQRLILKQCELQMSQKICQLQYQKGDDNKDIQKDLKFRFLELHREQTELRLNIQKNKQKIQEIGKQVEKQMQYIAALRQLQKQEGIFVEEQSEVDELELLFILDQNQQKYVEIRNNQLTVKSDTDFKSIKLRSNISVPLFQNHSFLIEIGVVHHGLTIGLTKQKLDFSLQSSDSLGLNTQEGSIYIHGLPRIIHSPIELTEADQVKVVVHRAQKIAIFQINSEQIGFIKIPIELQQTRLYPFLELHSNDRIKLKATIKVQEE